MPDIALRSFSNTRGDYYTRLDTNTPTSRTPSMNRNVIRAAAARPRRYVDDPVEEEEAIGLLEEGGVEGEGVEEQEQSRSPSRLSRKRKRKSSGAPRNIPFRPQPSKFPPNIVRNQKYNVLTFFPLVFYEQFKFFFNLYFLLVALSQFIPALKIGFIATYIAPLAFVLSITIGKEAYDDYKRNLRDREANGQKYLVVDGDGPLSTKALPSSSLLVGHLVKLVKNSRVPADMVLLWTADPAGTCFVRTDQLDGETDWKMRVAVPETQVLGENAVAAIPEHEAEVYADQPAKDIHSFVGTFTLHGRTTPLTAENLLWANTVLASSFPVIGFVVYTGPDTRAVMNTSKPKSKVGLLEEEVNRLAKILCGVTFVLSVVLVALNGFRGAQHTLVVVFRFLILFSSIIPISLRVNLDLGKSLYSHQIMSDSTIKGTIVRTSTLPEELGRVSYLLSDKTGTLTRNEMEMRKLHMGTMSYGVESMDEVARQLSVAIAEGEGKHTHTHTRDPSSHVQPAGRGRRDMSSRVRDVVQALALCHNVTPVWDDNEATSIDETGNTTTKTYPNGTPTYQASSPDEVAIVTWTESIGLGLVYRDRTRIVLRAGKAPPRVGDATGQFTIGEDDEGLSPSPSPTPSTHDSSYLTFDILSIFPFTSESKRMGIIIRETTPGSRTSGDLWFILKGADVVMAPLVQRNDWLEEETSNMAREGLRTLVVARKKLSVATWKRFDEEWREASTSVAIGGNAAESRASAQARVISTHLEHDMELLGLTGVEDRLQDDVRGTLEVMRNAGVKVWMLTGDKVETARCIAISTKMVGRGQYVHEVAKVKTSAQLKDHLDFLQNKLDCCLVIDGESLQLCLNLYKNEFIEIATKLSAVVACRCSPTQKADIARLIRSYTGKRVCCIGDGGNDVSMIQAADVGLGIEGKEGRQASLAADFSLTQFSHLSTLLLWHGRNSYRRSATLAQFVIHRGLIISIMQAVFSAIFYFAPIALYQGWLMVGYATVYTMMPVFSLVLDRDVSREMALVYPELYKELVKGRVLGYKSFFEWVMISVYQGAAIMIMSLVLFENEFLHIVSISFTALVLNELIMVALEITTWHTYMIISEVVTLFFYVISIAFLPEYFDLSFVVTLGFAWKVTVIVGISALPLWIVKMVKSRFAPAASSKLI
ncbi:protein transporter [Gymnopus androsaceus JB14]|uniref:Phospholipid-transporting ATPase n=1 Tax=Gymnopus androsaceus JB14 TaxID=1447944 RepID=A0A6A4IE94_9AGAR|nr:protein transporter [Gymnopus androsaceus JB14]